MFFNTLIKLDGVEAYGASPSVEAYGASASVEAYGASATIAVESRRGNNCPRLQNQSCVEGSTFSTPCGVATIVPEQLRLMELLFDVYFMCDVVRIFFTAVHEQGAYLTDIRIIAKSYAFSWLLIDLLTSFPFSRFNDGKGSAAKLLRILRLAKLLKLMRIVKMAVHECKTVQRGCMAFCGDFKG